MLKDKASVKLKPKFITKSKGNGWGTQRHIQHIEEQVKTAHKEKREP